MKSVVFEKTITVSRDLEICVAPEPVCDGYHLVYSKWADRKSYTWNIMADDRIKAIRLDRLNNPEQLHYTTQSVGDYVLFMEVVTREWLDKYINGEGTSFLSSKDVWSPKKWADSPDRRVYVPVWRDYSNHFILDGAFKPMGVWVKGRILSDGRYQYGYLTTELIEMVDWALDNPEIKIRPSTKNTCGYATRLFEYYVEPDHYIDHQLAPSYSREEFIFSQIKYEYEKVNQR